MRSRYGDYPARDAPPPAGPPPPGNGRPERRHRRTGARARRPQVCPIRAPRDTIDRSPAAARDVILQLPRAIRLLLTKGRCNSFSCPSDVSRCNLPSTFWPIASALYSCSGQRNPFSLGVVMLIVTINPHEPDAIPAIAAPPRASLPPSRHANPPPAPPDPRGCSTPAERPPLSPARWAVNPPHRSRRMRCGSSELVIFPSPIACSARP